jgi:hypothetical protein
MKNAARMMAIVVTMLPLLAAAQLNSSEKLMTQVPFQVRAANKVVPAGQCVVSLAGVDVKTLIIRDREGRVALIAHAEMDVASKAAVAPVLVFHKYGNQYFLWRLKIEGSRTVYQLPESKAEAEMRARNGAPAEEILLAALQ